MKPRPATMPVIHLSANSVAEATPHSAPLMSTPAYRIAVTLTPRVSAASGFSPTLRSRRPNTVLYRTNQASDHHGDEPEGQGIDAEELREQVGIELGLGLGAEEALAEEPGQADGEHVDGHAGDDVIHLEGDGDHGVDEAHQDPREDGHQQPDPDALEGDGAPHQRQCRYAHDAFQRDVHHAGPLGDTRRRAPRRRWARRSPVPWPGSKDDEKPISPAPSCAGNARRGRPPR